MKAKIIVPIVLLAMLAVLAWSGARFLSHSFAQAEKRETSRRVQLVQRALVQSGIARAGKSTPLFGRTFRAGEIARIEQSTATTIKSQSPQTRPRGNGFALVDARGKTLVWVRVESPSALGDLPQQVLTLGVLATLFASILILGCSALLVQTHVLPVAPQNEDAAMQGALELARKERRESEELFRQMAIVGSDVLYIMNPESGGMDWHGQIDLMLGYAHGSFPRTIEAWAEHIHPEEAPRVIALYSESCRLREPFSIEYRMRHRNGKYRDWSHRGKPMNAPEGMRVIGACSDVSERKRAERRLKASENRLARLVETVAEGIVICDREGVITFANPAAELVFGANVNEIVGRRYADAKWQIARSDGATLLESELPPSLVAQGEGSIHDIEHSITHSSGRVVIVSVNAAVLRDENEEISGCVLSLADVTGRKALEDRLSFQAFHDPLTKLPNRALFTDRLEHALIRATRSKTCVAVFFIDLDNFKKTNDTLGHDAGDVLLKTTAQRISASLRGGDTAARLGGDEFTILLENITEHAQVKIVADRVLQALLAPVEIGENTVLAPPSIGIALSAAGDTPETVMKNADAAMYEAKANGKARYEFHN